jgi:hypothetical protein
LGGGPAGRLRRPGPGSHRRAGAAVRDRPPRTRRPVAGPQDHGRTDRGVRRLGQRTHLPGWRRRHDPGRSARSHDRLPVPADTGLAHRPPARRPCRAGHPVRPHADGGQRVLQQPCPRRHPRAPRPGNRPRCRRAPQRRPRIARAGRRSIRPRRPAAHRQCPRPAPPVRRPDHHDPAGQSAPRGSGADRLRESGRLPDLQLRAEQGALQPGFRTRPGEHAQPGPVPGRLLQHSSHRRARGRAPGRPPQRGGSRPAHL